jgi:hypothetical protein
MSMEGASFLALDQRAASAQMSRNGRGAQPVPAEGSIRASGDGRGYLFACEVLRVHAPEILEHQGEEYRGDFTQRTRRLVCALLEGGDERRTYDLRFVASSGESDGDRLRVAVVGRVDGGTPENAARDARELLVHAEACFPEFQLALVPAASLAALLMPGPWVSSIEITRRLMEVRLDGVGETHIRSRAGFTPVIEMPASRVKGVDAVVYTAPFLPGPLQYAPLFDLLLAQEGQVAVSIRLRPTMLRADEAAFLERQIVRCERYGQIALGLPSEDVTALQPTLRDRAHRVQQELVRSLCALQAQAALVQVTVVSSRPVSSAVVGALGMVLTDPVAAPGRATALGDSLLAGGYVALRGSAAVAKAMGDLAFPEDDFPRTPGEAGRLLRLFHAEEAAGVFRFPPAQAAPRIGQGVRRWREGHAPRHLAPVGNLVGYSLRRGRLADPIRLGPEDRRRHVYLVGQTGTGKTTCLEHMILEDIRAGKGVCVIDPHGDLFRGLLGKIPTNRVGDVVVLDPTDDAFPVGLNLLEVHSEAERHFVVQELVGIVSRLLVDEYGLKGVGEFAGPIFFQHMRMNLLLAMSNPDDPGTLLEFHSMYQVPGYWQRWLPLRMTDPLLSRWVAEILPRTDYVKAGSDNASMGGYLASKFEGFVFDPMLRCLFGQKRSTVDLGRIMNHGQILLVNLAKGELTEATARFLGMVLLAKLMAVAIRRARLPEHQRREFVLYCDEYQALATESFVTLLSEARKFGVSLVLANQYLSQVRDDRIVQAIFGNVGTLLAFRLGRADAETFEKEFRPSFNQHDLRALPNWTGILSMLINGQPVRPFAIQTVPDSTAFDPGRACEVRQESRARYSRPRATVEAEVVASFALREVTADAGGHGAVG